MNLSLTEMRRAKLRFGLLTAAVALLVFLIVFLASISGALLRAFTGAIETLPARNVSSRLRHLRSGGLYEGLL